MVLFGVKSSFQVITDGSQQSLLNAMKKYQGKVDLPCKCR